MVNTLFKIFFTLIMIFIGYSYSFYEERNLSLLSLYNSKDLDEYREIPPNVSKVIICILNKKKGGGVDFQLAKPLAGYSLSNWINTGDNPGPWYSFAKYYSAILISNLWENREKRVSIFLYYIKYKDEKLKIKYGFINAARFYYKKEMNLLTENEVEQIIQASYDSQSSPKNNSKEFYDKFHRENIDCSGQVEKSESLN